MVVAAGGLASACATVYLDRDRTNLAFGILGATICGIAYSMLWSYFGLLVIVNNMLDVREMIEKRRHIFTPAYYQYIVEVGSRYDRKCESVPQEPICTVEHTFLHILNSNKEKLSEARPCTVIFFCNVI